MSRSSRTLAIALGFAVATGLPARAVADSASTAPSLEQVEAARVPFREARELYRQGRLNEAVAKMLDAYEMAKTPVLALEAGRLLVEAGHLVRARDLLRGVAGLPASPRETNAGREARRDAAMLAADLDTRIPKIALAERPAQVGVLLDGKPFAPSDSSAWQGVDPGEHAIVVTFGDHLCASIGLTLAERQEKTVDLRNAAVSCRPPEDPVPPPPPEATRVTPATPAPEGRSASSWRWGGAALAGAGAIALGASVYVAVRARSDYDSVAAECAPSGCDAPAYAVRHHAHEQANVATVVGTVGIAAMAGGALWFVLGRPHGDGAPSVRAAVGPTGASLLVPFDM